MVKAFLLSTRYCSKTDVTWECILLLIFLIYVQLAFISMFLHCNQCYYIKFLNDDLWKHFSQDKIIIEDLVFTKLCFMMSMWIL